MTEQLNFEEAELLFYLYIRETNRRPSTHRTVLLLVSDFTFCLARYVRGQFSNLINSLLLREVISVSQKSVDFISWDEKKLHDLTNSISLAEVEPIIPGPLEDRIVKALFFQKNYKKLETWLSASKFAGIVLCRYAVDFKDVKAFRLLLWYHDPKDSIVQLYGYSLIKSLRHGVLQFIDILLKDSKICLQDLLYFARETNRYAEFEIDDHERVCAVIHRFGECGVIFDLLDRLKMVNKEDGWVYADNEKHYWKGYKEFLQRSYSDIGFDLNDEVVGIVVAYLRPKSAIH